MKNGMVMSSWGFLSTFYILQWSAGEAGNPETLLGAGKKSPNKNLLSLDKKTEEGQPSKTEDF